MEKRFIIKKYVFAKSASHAIRKEKTVAVDDVWLDDEWKKIHDACIERDMGFRQ